jgi:hypothetical protein
MAIRLFQSGYFYGASAVVGAAITYGASIETVLIEALLKGAFWGAFVGGSIALLIDSAMNFSKEKWHVVGWLTVAVLYGYWVTFLYEGDPDMPPSESIYWRVLGWSLASALLGWLALGSLLSSHLNRKRP